jgi:hypothetical protein
MSHSQNPHAPSYFNSSPQVMGGVHRPDPGYYIPLPASRAELPGPAYYNPVNGLRAKPVSKRLPSSGEPEPSSPQSEPPSAYPQRTSAQLLEESIANSADILMSRAETAADKAVLLAFKQLEKQLKEMQQAADATAREDQMNAAAAANAREESKDSHNAGAASAAHGPRGQDVTFHNGKASIVNDELVIADLVPTPKKGVWADPQGATTSGVGDRAFAAQGPNGWVLVYFGEDGLVRFRAYSSAPVSYNPSNEPAESIKEYTSREDASEWFVRVAAIRE